jgi:hypothetical protein
VPVYKEGWRKGHDDGHAAGEAEGHVTGYSAGQRDSFTMKIRVVSAAIGTAALLAGCSGQAGG